MITREQLIEIEFLIRDMRMALDFKENMDKNEPFTILPLMGENNIRMVFDEAKKTEINSKIFEVEKKLKLRLAELK